MIELDRVLPNNLDAERAVLGAILQYRPALFEASELLESSDFYTEAHRAVYDAFRTLESEQSDINILTLKNILQRTNKLEMCGGVSYVASLTDGIPGSLKIAPYAAMVKECSTLRKLIQYGNDAMMRAYSGEEKSADIIGEFQLKLIQLVEQSNKTGWLKISELVGEAYKEIEELAERKRNVVGLESGFKDLDRLTQGFQPGQLIIIAGRPGHGKSSIGLNLIAHAILRERKRVGLFTIEMGAREIVKRIIFSEAEVDSHRAGIGAINGDDWRRMAKSAGQLAETQLSVDESGSLTISDLRAKAQQLSAGSGLHLLVIDYLQLMSGMGRQKNRIQEITDITRGLKSLAKDLNIPIIAMSQLNREVEKETSRRPRLSDLRESGSIEQDADVVLFIWREELRERKEDNIGQAELIIGKQRNGPVGETVHLQFLKQFTKFVETSKREENESSFYWQDR